MFHNFLGFYSIYQFSYFSYTIYDFLAYFEIELLKICSLIFIFNFAVLYSDAGTIMQPNFRF